MFILLLALLVTGCRCQVFQPPQITTAAGTPVRINCTQNTTSKETMFWYRQHQEGPLEFLGSAFEGTKEAGTFTMIAVQSERATSLSKDSVEPVDSATYYCAMNSASYTLTFGSGTLLRVTPNIKNSAPSAYVLKPAAGSEDQVGTACLVTDFSPAGNVTVYLNETEKGVRPATLVESEKKWSYGIVEWSPKKQDDQFKCRAEYKGQTIEAQEWKEDTQKSCSVISVSEYFETDEKLNTLSLTVLGLKIIFMKSIAFNLLMTLRLWTS